MQGDNALNANSKHPIITPTRYWNGAIYAEGFYRYSERLGFHLGSRYDIHTRTARFGGVISPKAALLFTPVPGHTVKAVIQSSSNNGTVDNYEYNFSNYDDSGKVISGDRLDRTDVPPGSITNLQRGAPPWKRSTPSARNGTIPSSASPSTPSGTCSPSSLRSPTIT